MGLKIEICPCDSNIPGKTLMIEVWHWLFFVDVCFSVSRMKFRRAINGDYINW